MHRGETRRGELFLRSEREREEREKDDMWLVQDVGERKTGEGRGEERRHRLRWYCKDGGKDT